MPPTGYTPPTPGQYPGVVAQPHVTRKNEGLAAVLSVLWTGLGQIYNGQIAKGLVFMVLGIVFAITIIFLIGIILYPVFWIYNIYDAYNTAKQINAGTVRV